MSGVKAALRMILGGAMCGGFLGMFAGGISVGFVCTLTGDFSVGLDGALVGGGVGCLCGVLFGAYFAAGEGGAFRTVVDAPSQQPDAAEGRTAEHGLREEVGSRSE